MIKIFPDIKHLDISDHEISKIKFECGTCINYATIGKGKTIIMIHGMANNWISLVPMSKLLKKKYKVILVDLPGYGDSSSLDKHTIDNLAEYLIKFIEKLKEKPISIVGFSMSGSVVAESIRIKPEIASSAIILGPYVSFINKERLSGIAYWFYKATSENRIFDLPIKKIIELRISGYLAGRLLNMHKFDARLIDTLSVIGRKKLKPGVYSQVGYSAMNYRLDKTFNQISNPLMLIIGNRDKIISPTQLQEVINQNNKKIKIKVVKDSGHALNMEAIKECVFYINQFLSSSLPEYR